MSAATFIVGDVFEVLAGMPDKSVHSVITSPPYWRKRRYLPPDHPQAHLEIGQEPSPGEFLAALLRVTDELWRIVRDDGTIWINLGDTAAGSGGAGGDYDEGGQREGQNRYVGTARAIRDNGNRYAPAKRDVRPAGRVKTLGNRQAEHMPLRKSVCWIPELFGASLAYGRNLLTGEPCRQWITRPPVVWCKPSPTPGEIIDKFREATELFVWAAKQPRYYFDLDAVRLPAVPENQRDTRNQDGPKQRLAAASEAHPIRYTKRTTNPKGAPPLNWWEIPNSGYGGAHFATFPPELLRRPLLASVPAQVCSVCGKGRERIHERSWELDESRPQAKRALELARAGGLTPAHFEAIAAHGISDVGKNKVTQGGAGRNIDGPQNLAADAKAVLGGYFREFIGAPLVHVGWTDCGCPNRDWVPGTVLDPFAGSGTTATVATGHGRNCISIDFDATNADLARERVGMFLTVEDHTTEATSA